MPARLSLFLKSELLSLLLLAYPPLSSECIGRQVWGFPVQELKENLFRARYGALSGLDAKSVDLLEVMSLGPGSPYYMSFVFGKLGRPDMARSMLELAWDRSPRPWKEEAGLALADLLLQGKDYPRAKKICRALLSMRARAPSAGLGSLEERARRLLVEALYWGKEDEETLAEAARISSPDPELALFSAVSSLRLKRDAARGLFVDLFLTQKISPLHARAWLFLSADPEAMKIFSDDERALFEAKYAFEQGDWAKGVPLMEGVIARIDPSRLSASPLISELGAAYLSGSMASRGAEFLAKLADGLLGEPLLDALEAAGKCRRRVQDYQGAITSFRALAAAAADPARQDLARWLILDVLLRANPPDLMETIGKESLQWNDASSFSDLLEDRISDLVADRKWKEIARLYSALGERSPAPLEAQLAYILARALQEKLVSIDAFNPMGGAESLLRIAADRDPYGYYGVLAACMLGQAPAPLGAAVSPGGLMDVPPREDPLLQGYLSFGLTREAFDVIWDGRDGLADGELAAYAGALAAAGDYRSAMNLSGCLARRRPLSPEEMEVLFPRAYRAFIEDIAAHSRFPSQFLYGLIREESYFDPGIVSGAGAVGLAQLMPETAADAAKSLRMPDPILTDPEVSLKLGVYHLEKLHSRVGSIPKALLAYNAGLSRIRSWDRKNGDLSVDLFVEAVPYVESRQYVRKILVSSVIYAGLYGKGDPREAARLFYPDLPFRLPGHGSP